MKKISYKPFFKTIKNMGLSQYKLENEKISKSTLQRIRESKPLKTTTLEDIMNKLDIHIFDIISEEETKQ